MRRHALIGLAAMLCVAVPAVVQAAVGVGAGGGTPGTSSNFELVGHEPLFNRGMHAAPAVFDRRGGPFVYIGNRTDGQARHPRPGILVVNAHKPSKPRVVGEIGPPHAGNVGETTRELRVWPDERLLIVLNFRCSPTIHDCAGNDPGPSYRFFDLRNPRNPRHLLTFVPRQADGTVRVPHEFFLWIDPEDDDRALIWESYPTTSSDPNRANMIIRDISRVPDGGEPFIVAQGNWNQLYEGGGQPAAAFDNDLALHSMTPSFDGTRTHLAYLRGNYLVLDTTKVAKDEVPPGAIENLNDDLLTPPANRPQWGEPGNTCVGHTPLGCEEAHSALELPGREVALVIDEVYGTFTFRSFGWPWGWARLIDFSDPAHPVIVGEYKIFQNTEAFRPFVDPATDAFTSYSSHNPTPLPELVFEAWHSGGLQAIDVADAANPKQAGWFSPTPLAAVATEDPALSRGPNKVVMWSFPIIVDGLIYVVDIRNGLYILRYTGKDADEVEDIEFLEGNSNLGDAGDFSERDDDEDDEDEDDEDDNDDD
jgi:hypothetical protein